MNHAQKSSGMNTASDGSVSGIQLGVLRNSDGSASYTPPSASHNVIASVHYPLETAYRSNELPSDTYIEVNIRPYNAVGQVKERHMEELVRRVLQGLVLGETTPRQMLQVTLQIGELEMDESLPGGVKSGGQGESYLSTLCSCVNAAVLGCLDAGVMMKGYAGCCMAAVSKDGQVQKWPTLIQRRLAKSLHIFVLTRDEQCLLMESEGDFTMDEWQQVYECEKAEVVGQADDAMDIDQNVESMLAQFREAMKHRAALQAEGG